MTPESDAPPPTYAEPVHACPPPDSGIMPCCGRTPFEVPSTDRMTSTEPVTCRATPPAPEVADCGRDHPGPCAWIGKGGPLEPICLQPERATPPE